MNQSLFPSKKASALDCLRVSRTIRAARKLRGLSQAALGQRVGLSQAAVSRLESGGTIPPTSVWFLSCKVLDIDPSIAFYRGLVDALSDSSNGHPFPESRFRLPRIYSRNAGSTVRSTLPFLEYFTTIKGTEIVDRYILSKKIDPDFFLIYDNPISINFSLELMSMLSAQKALSTRALEIISSMAVSDTVLGKATNAFDRSLRPREMMKSLIKSAHYYEVNYTYEIAEETNRSLTILGKPSYRLLQSKPKTDNWLNMANDYKRHFIKSVSTLATSPAKSVETIHIPRRNNDWCAFKVSF